MNPASGLYEYTCPDTKPFRTIFNMLIFFFFFRYLLDNGADVAAVNNEGELPLDLAEEEDMEDLLTDEIERLGMLMCLLPWYDTSSQLTCTLFCR